MPVFERPEAELHFEAQTGWRGPTHLAESIRRVGEYPARNTPA